jgi:hypothetical protein
MNVSKNPLVKRMRLLKRLRELRKRKRDQLPLVSDEEHAIAAMATNVEMFEVSLPGDLTYDPNADSQDESSNDNGETREQEPPEGGLQQEDKPPAEEVAEKKQASMQMPAKKPKSETLFDTLEITNMIINGCGHQHNHVSFFILHVKCIAHLLLCSFWMFWSRSLMQMWIL